MYISGGVAVVIFIILVFLGTFNSFVSLDQEVDGKWANVETQYQRRVDLIPNLVRTIEGVSDFEQETLTEITRLRSQWQTQPEQRLETANQLESTLSKLIFIAESYPQLQATQSYIDLLVQLECTENRISFARQEYNNSVRKYNTSIKSIPGVFLAGMLGFEEKEFFEAITEGAEQAPDVDFN